MLTHADKTRKRYPIHKKILVGATTELTSETRELSYRLGIWN